MLYIALHLKLCVVSLLGLCVVSHLFLVGSRLMRSSRGGDLHLSLELCVVCVVSLLKLCVSSRLVLCVVSRSELCVVSQLGLCVVSLL